jgi:hypothetical protein
MDREIEADGRQVRASITLTGAHCKEDSNYVFPEIKLRDLVPSVHIQKYVNDLYISRIGPPILLQPNRQTDLGNI